MNAPVPNQPPQDKKGSSGCLLALGITSGVLLLLAGIVALGLIGGGAVAPFIYTLF